MFLFGVNDSPSWVCGSLFGICDTSLSIADESASAVIVSTVPIVKDTLNNKIAIFFAFMLFILHFRFYGLFGLKYVCPDSENRLSQYYGNIITLDERSIYTESKYLQTYSSGVTGK